jgi:outer membrane protein assembly factor BamB
MKKKRYAAAIIFCAFIILAFFTISCGGGGGGGGGAPNAWPTAQFTANPASGALPLDVTFDASTSADPDGTIVMYAWDFGDGASANGNPVTHRYTVTGTYNVTLTVTDNGGASNVTSGSVIVHRTIWSLVVDKPVYYSSPAIGADGTIYFATGVLFYNTTGSLHAAKPDGTLKWSYALENSSDDNNIWTADNNGASPAIGPDGTVYLVDHRNVVYAVNPDGTEKWKRKAPLESDGAWHVGQKTPALAADGTLYVCAGLTLYALDPDDGTITWSVPNLRGGNVCATSVSVAGDGTIYVVSNDGLYAINPNGTFKWPAPFLLTYNDEKSYSAPAIGPDGTVYFGAERYPEGYLYAVKSDGTLKWRYTVPGKRCVRASPAIGIDGTVYVTTKAYWDDTAPEPRQPALCLAFNPDGTLKWSYEITASDWIPVAQDSYSSPAIGADGTIYFGAETTFIYALNADGTLKWKENFNNGINWSSPAIIADGTLYLGGFHTLASGEAAGRLVAIRTDSAGLAASSWPKFHRDNRNAGRAN